VVSRSKGAALAEALDRLETHYGKLVSSDDPVEAGVLALLAMHDPKRSTVETRDRLRSAFTDWNEARTADPWEITSALGASGDPDARAFARAMLKFLESIQSVLHRTSFDAVRSDPQADLPALLERMRGVVPEVRAVVLAALDPAAGWHPGSDMAKALQKLGVVGKTASAAKAGKDVQAEADPKDRLRAHYLLTRWALRQKTDEDPLGGPAKKAKPSGKKVAAKPASAAPKAAKPAKSSNSKAAGAKPGHAKASTEKAPG
jgi:hypothetical protein